MVVASRSSRQRAQRRSTSILVGAVALVLVGLGVWLLTQNGGSRVVSQTRPVPPFSAVELAGDNVVTVDVGAQQSVVVHAHRNMLGQVSTGVLAGTLVIANAPSPRGTKGPISVSVALPSLKSLTIAQGGSGVITVTGINNPSFTATLAGDGVLHASGTATRLDVSLGGSGDVEFEQLVTRDAHAVLSGSGRIVVAATRGLNASVSGDGVIQYGGNPTRLTKSVTGSGAIIPG